MLLLHHMFRKNLAERILKLIQLMIRLEIKNDNMTLTEKQLKYQYYHLEKLIHVNILQVNK